MAEGLGGVHGKYRGVDADYRGRTAWAGVPAGGIADERLLRRAPAGKQFVWRDAGVRGFEERRAEVALPVGASPTVGHGHFFGADSGGHHRGWEAGESGGAAEQAGMSVCVRSRDGEAGVAVRGEARGSGDGARRMVFGDAADSEQTA